MNDSTVLRAATVVTMASVLGLAGLLTAEESNAATRPSATHVIVKTPRGAHAVKRGVTHSGHYKFVRYDKQVFVIHTPGKNPGWQRTVYFPRKRAVVKRYSTKHYRCVIYNQSVPHGKGPLHRTICTPKVSRETVLRRR